MILVTGGTGLIGARLLYELARKEQQIRAIYRKDSDIDAVARMFAASGQGGPHFDRIEWVEADITDVPALSRAFEGVSRVYHAAALISFDPKDYNLLKKINTEGTANVVNFCLSGNVEKLCYVSSVATLGKKGGGEPITEETQWNVADENNVYALTKYGAEMEVWRGSQEGLNVVIINPGIVLGAPPAAEGWKKGSGKLFYEIDRGLKYYTNGVTGYVDVDDVVAVMTRLMESGIRNERYITVAENRSYRDLFTSVAITLGKRPPGKEVPAWVLALLWRLDGLKSLFTGSRRKITRLLAGTVRTANLYSNEKVTKELGMEFRPLDETIERVGQSYLSSRDKR